MDVRLLIDSIVRQTTVLIAQLATQGGSRAPLAHVANQVFFELSEELRRQGVSRKVSADMFGLALRTYLRRVQRSNESQTTRGTSLWKAVYDFVSERRLSLKAEVLQHFHRDAPESVSGVLHDLTESGLVFRIGSGDRTAFRAATAEELSALERKPQSGGEEELLWAIIYREGPIALGELQQRSDPESLDRALSMLLASGRIVETQADDDPHYDSTQFFAPLESDQGWAGAVFDHFHAVVKTICAKLDGEASPSPRVGGSTYSIDVWDGHPHRDEVVEQLARWRERTSELRRKVSTYNDANVRPAHFQKVTLYAGQCVLDEQDPAEDTGASE